MGIEDDWAGFCRLWRELAEEGWADDAHGAQFRRAWGDYCRAKRPRRMRRWLIAWLVRDASFTPQPEGGPAGDLGDQG